MPKLISKNIDELKKQTKAVIKILEKKYGEVKCFLTHKNEFELLCAVMLSAQCTDDRVNIVTPGLFKKYPTAKKLSLAKLSDVEELIKSCGFYKNKAKNLIAMAQRLMSHHSGKIPETIEELTALAGVGRKTANVVLGIWFGKSAGVVVDTHVKRITNLLGLSFGSDPENIEKELSLIVPKKHWDMFSLWLISHGRETCIARRPQCSECLLAKHCDYMKNK